jgi:hypothetical protein
VQSAFTTPLDPQMLARLQDCRIGGLNDFKGFLADRRSELVRVRRNAPIFSSNNLTGNIVELFERDKHLRRR